MAESLLNRVSSTLKYHILYVLHIIWYLLYNLKQSPVLVRLEDNL